MRNIRHIPILPKDGCGFLRMIKELEEDDYTNDIDHVITEGPERIYCELAEYSFSFSVHCDHLCVEYVMTDEGEELDIDEFLSNIDMVSFSYCVRDLFNCYMKYLARKLDTFEQKKHIIEKFSAIDVKYISFDLQIKELLKKGGKV